MLILTIHNDGTGDEEAGNYDCEVLVMAFNVPSVERGPLIIDSMAYD